MIHDPSPAAIAAFDICDALLMALVEHKVLASDQVLVLLQEVADRHSDTSCSKTYAELHRGTANMVEMLIRSITDMKC